jgi:hypothetical protein
LQDTLGIKYTMGYGWVKFGNLIDIVKVCKETVEVEGIAEAVCLIEREKVGSGNLDATMLKHPALIGDVESVDEFVLLVFCLIFGGVSSCALYFVDNPTIGGIAEKVNGTIVAIVGEGRFGNYGRLRIY